MKTKIMLFVLLSQPFAAANCDSRRPQELANSTQRSAPTPRNREWRAATYRGLTVGKSTGADMLRVFGKPHRSGPPGDQAKQDPNPQVWNEYQGGGEFAGKLTVVTDKNSGVILRIDFYPESLFKEEAVRHFGNDYLATKYEFDKCLGEEESAPLYEDSGGTVLYLEYRDRGIAIAIDEQTRVGHISYVNKPIGAPSSRCKTQ